MKQYFIFFVVYSSKSIKFIKIMRNIAQIALFSLLCFFSSQSNLYSQINAIGKFQEQVAETQKATLPFLQNAHRNIAKGNLPYFLHHTIISGNFAPQFEMRDVVVRELNADELKQIESFSKYITGKFESTSFTEISAHELVLFEKIIPVRLNASTNRYEYLESYTPFWNQQKANTTIALAKNKRTAGAQFANNSVLSSGQWYKLGLTQEGVYKLNKSFFSSLGINVNNIDPRNIRIYGNGGKLMPEANSHYRPDDLLENPIYVHGESDGVFHDTDYVLLYGQSTDSWEKNIQPGFPYKHQLHYFSDTSFYFVTVDLGTGKRITLQPSPGNAPDKTTSSYDYMGFHEENLVNVVKSGREFFGEKFDITTSFTYGFNIPNAVVGDSVYVYASVLSRSGQSSVYAVNFNTGSFTFTCSATNLNSYLADVGYTGEGVKGGLLSSTFLNISVSKQSAAATGWLDKVEFNCRRNLVLNQLQFNYRDKRVVGGAGTYSKYILTSNTLATPWIWDVTNPFDIKRQDYTVNGNQLEYVSASDSLREYCIFTSAMTYTNAKAYGSIPNQNLHGIQQADFVIVTHPDFLSEAVRVAAVHQQYDSLTYAIATTQQVYNEFSSGTPDIGGIRDFVRMLYKRPADPTKATKYLLLLGDGSYKNKEISISTNSALIPTYETPSSTSWTNSFVSDDYFAMMDDNEGEMVSGLVDIGVGRFPVRSKAEAQAVTAKIEHYYKKNYSFDVNAVESSCKTTENDYSLGDWRNWICFVADDEDSNEHLNQANSLATQVYSGKKNYNVDKIFLDSYVQYSTPGGDRYPDAVTDINRRIEKGALILNYTGHGGELGLAEERIVEVPQILGWTNKNNMPLFVTATCEFSRFDDPDRTSAGEYCFLNPQGGAIGLMTTVRLAFSGLNFSLNTFFYNHALSPMSNGQMPHIGDLYRLTKRDLGFSEQYMNFVILGDPALKLAYPEERIYTATINSQSVSPSSSDTLRALSVVTVTGFVGDKNGNKLSSFNGVVYPTVFDKENTITTLGNDPGSLITTFKLQKNIIYKGKSSVVNGDFSFSFLVPRDISYNFGIGKISYYAHNGITDANGYYDKIVIGGSNPNAASDNAGPEIKLFMNDEKFVSGGTTNESPKLYAVISDSSGVNTVGTGIGHDALAILDANSSKPIILNDYYVSDLNTYKSGKIRYPFSELSEGSHNLTLKVWDVQNNSTTAYTDFIVAKQAELALTHILNYPNPFTTKTKFFIEHNQCCTSLKVLIQIYTISGKVVKSINQTINNEGFRFDGIEWDGKDEFGDKLARGVYIYKVSVTDGDKKKADKIEKLVILN